MHELNDKGGRTDDYHYNYGNYTGKMNKGKKIMSFSKRLSGKRLCQNKRLERTINDTRKFLKAAKSALPKDKFKFVKGMEKEMFYQTVYDRLQKQGKLISIVYVHQKDSYYMDGVWALNRLGK